MPFPTYDISKPVQSQSITDLCTSIRDMETINRAAMVVNTMPGWVMDAPTGGTAPYYTTYIYRRGAEYVKQTVVWGTGGDPAGYLNNPKTIKYEYSDNSGTNWYVMFPGAGLQTFTYTAEGYCSGWTWS